MNKEQGLFF